MTDRKAEKTKAVQNAGFPGRIRQKNKTERQTENAALCLFCGAVPGAGLDFVLY
jgi:hypothetical protein